MAGPAGDTLQMFDTEEDRMTRDGPLAARKQQSIPVHLFRSRSMTVRKVTDLLRSARHMTHTKLKYKSERLMLVVNLRCRVFENYL